MKGASQISPFGLRMPEDLKEAIAERAKKNGRSMNSEIVQILEDAIESEGKGITLFPNQNSIGKKYEDESSPEFQAAINLARVIMQQADDYYTGKLKKP